MATIKSKTIEIIEEVLSQGKKFYRSSEFYFPVHKNGYSTHQGAVLRHYLRDNGYVTVRVSEINEKFFVDNQQMINKSLRGKSINQVLLKPSNTIIIKVEDYLQYKKNMFTPENFNKNLLQFPLHHDKPKGLKPEVAVIGIEDYKNFREALKPVTLNNKPVIVLLVDKYSKKLKTIMAYYELNKDDLPMHEITDLEQKIRDLAEIVQDLTSIL